MSKTNLCPPKRIFPRPTWFGCKYELWIFEKKFSLSYLLHLPHAYCAGSYEFHLSSSAAGGSPLHHLPPLLPPSPPPPPLPTPLGEAFDRELVDFWIWSVRRVDRRVDRPTSIENYWNTSSIRLHREMIVARRELWKGGQSYEMGEHSLFFGAFQNQAFTLCYKWEKFPKPYKSNLRA